MDASPVETPMQDEQSEHEEAANLDEVMEAPPIDGEEVAAPAAAAVAPEAKPAKKSFFKSLVSRFKQSSK